MSTVLDELNENIKNLKLAKLEELKAQLTESQLKKLSMIYPNGIGDNHFEDAIRLMGRTIKKNKKDLIDHA